MDGLTSPRDFGPMESFNEVDTVVGGKMRKSSGRRYKMIALFFHLKIGDVIDNDK